MILDRALTEQPFEQMRARRSLMSDLGHGFMRNKGSLVSAVILGLLVILASIGPEVAPFDPTQQVLTEAKQGPSAKHLMGTDQSGRDILSRVMVGSRNTLGLPLLAIAFAVVLGVMPGLVAGYAGGWIDSLIMRLVDILLAFPGILLALMIVAMLGTGLIHIMYAIGISLVPVYVRMARGSTLSIRNEAYIEAARVLGSGRTRHPDAAHLAESARPIDRPLDDGHRLGHSGWSGSQLPRPRRAPANARVGQRSLGRS